MSSSATQSYLVTGGSGFIGSALVRKLIGAGHRVTNLDALTYAATPGALGEVEANERYRLVHGSISDKRIVNSVIIEARPKAVFNLAAESHVDRSIDDPSPFIMTNVVGTTTLLEESTSYWRQLEPHDQQDFRFVHVSTDEVFGSIEDGMFTGQTLYNPSSPYAASKAAGDHLVHAWHRTFGLPVLLTNCTNNYGPFQFPEKLIPLMIVRALEERSLPVYGDGGQIRDWIHVDDHVDGMTLVERQGEPGGTYLIGSRSPRTNLELVTGICRILDELTPRPSGKYEELVEFVADRPGHDRRYALDPSSTEGLGFEPQRDLDSGLRETVSWYLANRDWWQSILDERYATERLGVR